MHIHCCDEVDPSTVCPDPSAHEGAAPRAEGLPDAPVAVRDALHATFRPATPRGEPITEEWLNVFTESLTAELRKRGVGFARLSRPSDERVPEGETCKRFRHDEHCGHD